MGVCREEIEVPVAVQIGTPDPARAGPDANDLPVGKPSPPVAVHDIDPSGEAGSREVDRSIPVEVRGVEAVGELELRRDLPDRSKPAPLRALEE